MSTNAFFQPDRNASVRQHSGVPNAYSNADEPQSKSSERFRNLPPGQAISRVVILTALPEEFSAIKMHLEEVNEDVHPEYKTVYERGLFISQQSTWEVCIVETGPGNTIAADETQRALAYFAPEVTLFVGVAGGLKDVKIGDVVAGNKVYNYESGRDEISFRTRPEVGNTSYPLEQRARATVRSWLERRKLAGNDNLPRAFVGAIAAGESVIASSESETANLIHRNYGDALAVEKEGYGFLEAARRSQNVAAIVIRGISDLLDNKEESDKDGSQELAASNASAFAFEMLAKLHKSENPVVDVASSDKQETQVIQYQGGKLYLDLVWTPPPSMAIIQIEKNDDGYLLHAHHSQLSTLKVSESCTTLPIELGQFSQFQPWTIDTVGKLEGYKPRDCMIGQTLKWLRYLQLHESSLECLVIVETSKSTIPWELLNLGDQALGLVLQTVRVSDIVDNIEVDTRPLDSQGRCCEGQAIFYVPAGGAQSIKAELYLRTQSYGCNKIPYENPEQIFRHFRESNMKVGLLMMASSELQQVPVDRRRFLLKRNKLFKKSSSLVMLQPGDGDTNYRLLASEFLEYGAEGVLGMLEVTKASSIEKVIERFLEEYCHNTNAFIPEILRQMRQTVAELLDEKLTNEIAQLYLATCLYAYYGHPTTSLQLTSAQEVPHA